MPIKKVLSSEYLSVKSHKHGGNMIHIWVHYSNSSGANILMNILAEKPIKTDK
jgi:hypothetical protein